MSYLTLKHFLKSNQKVIEVVKFGFLGLQVRLKLLFQ